MDGALEPLRNLVGQLRANFSSQSKLLPVLIDIYASQSSIRRQAAQVREQQGAYFQGLLDAFDAFQSIGVRLGSLSSFQVAFASRLKALEQQAVQLQAAIQAMKAQQRPTKAPPAFPGQHAPHAPLESGGSPQDRTAVLKQDPAQAAPRSAAQLEGEAAQCCWEEGNFPKRARVD
jgi:hypothetical protein